MTTRDFLSAFGRIPPRHLELAIRGLCLLLLVGLAFKSMLLAHWGLVATLVVLSTILAINTAAPLFRQPPPIPDSIFMLAIVVTVLLTTFYIGLPGAIWTFPALVGLRYSAPEARSGPLRWALVLMVPMLVALHGDLPNAGRIFAAAAITALYLWLAEGQVISLQSRLDQDEGRDPLTRAFTAARLEKDLELIPQLAPVSLLLLRIDGVAQLRARAQGSRADEVLRAVAQGIRPSLSMRERLYRLGDGEFLIGLAGWRSFEGYELGQQLREVLADRVPAGLDLQIGVAEVYETEGFPAALDAAYAQSFMPDSLRGAPSRPQS